MSAPFFPITTAFIVNGAYVKGPYLSDLNWEYVNWVIKSKALNEKDQSVDVFEIHYREPLAAKPKVYVFLAGTQTITDLKTWFDNNCTGNQLAKYTGLKAVDLYIEKKYPYGDVLVNEKRITSRELVPATGDTNLYVDGGVNQADKRIFTVSGDQTDTDGGAGYPGPGVIV